MNERIQLLAEQSGMTQYVAAHNKYLERFAELIVKECQMQNVITACSLELDANPFVDQITKHFGV